MKNHARKLLAALALMACFLSSACDPFAYAQIDAVSVMGSDRTVIDHMVSLSSGKDCSTLRKERGLTYCAEDMPKVTQELYCYRDLGGVTCYDKPNPYKGEQLRVDRNEHNQVK